MSRLDARGRGSIPTPRGRVEHDFLGKEMALKVGLLGVLDDLSDEVGMLADAGQARSREFAADIAKRALARGGVVPDLVLATGVVPAEQLDRLLESEQLAGTSATVSALCRGQRTSVSLEPRTP